MARNNGGIVANVKKVTRDVKKFEKKTSRCLFQYSPTKVGKALSAICNGNMKVRL